MDNLLAGIIDNVIGLGLMTTFLFVFKRQQAQDPEKKPGGIPIRTVIVMCYIGIGIELVLILHTILG